MEAQRKAKELLSIHYSYKEDEDDDDEPNAPSTRKTLQSSTSSSREADSGPEQRTTKRPGKVSRRKPRNYK